MTQTPREAAEAKIAALRWASKALRSLGTWDAVKAIDERIAALSLPAAPSEPTAEGQEDELKRKADVEIKQLWFALMKLNGIELAHELTTANADLARMKAVLEWIVTPNLGMMHLIFRQEAKIRAEEALATLKGISP